MLSGSAAQFVILGGGQAGAWVARSLRTEGFAGRIVMIAEEQHWPYERPPLSKSVLLGAGQADEGTLLTEAQASDLGIDVRRGLRALGIDRASRSVTCSGGVHIGYDKLFLTMGSRPRSLPQANEIDPNRVHYLRTRDDARRLKMALVPGQRLAVLGGGWIGLEVAASARTLGLAVTVIEAASRVCGRSVPAVVSAYLQDIHAKRGVTIRTARTVHSLFQHDGNLTAILNDESRIEADHILVGIGVLPNTELAETCGLEVKNGIVVDAAGRTSDQDIFAAGDVTAHFSRFAGKSIRLESWANAQSQGIIAAQAALGKSVVYDEIPWLWSDQFDVNIQIVGFPDRAVSILRQGAPECGKGCWLMLDANNDAVGAVAANAPRELRAVRKTLQARGKVDLASWSDPVQGA